MTIQTAFSFSRLRTNSVNKRRFYPIQSILLALCLTTSSGYVVADKGGYWSDTFCIISTIFFSWWSSHYCHSQLPAEVTFEDEGGDVHYTSYTTTDNTDDGKQEDARTSSDTTALAGKDEYELSIETPTAYGHSDLKLTVIEDRSTGTIAHIHLVFPDSDNTDNESPLFKELYQGKSDFDYTVSQYDLEVEGTYDLNNLPEEAKKPLFDIAEGLMQRDLLTRLIDHQTQHHGFEVYDPGLIDQLAYWTGMGRDRLDSVNPTERRYSQQAAIYQLSLAVTEFLYAHPSIVFEGIEGMLGLLSEDITRLTEQLKLAVDSCQCEQICDIRAKLDEESSTFLDLLMPGLPRYLDGIQEQVDEQQQQNRQDWNALIGPDVQAILAELKTTLESVDFPLDGHSYNDKANNLELRFYLDNEPGSIAMQLSNTESATRFDLSIVDGEIELRINGFELADAWAMGGAATGQCIIDRLDLQEETVHKHYINNILTALNAQIKTIQQSELADPEFEPLEQPLVALEEAFANGEGDCHSDRREMMEGRNQNDLERQQEMHEQLLQLRWLCFICYQPIDNGQAIAACGHPFHPACLHDFAGVNCPLCGRNLNNGGFFENYIRGNTVKIAVFIFIAISVITVNLSG